MRVRISKRVGPVRVGVGTRASAGTVLLGLLMAAVVLLALALAGCGGGQGEAPAAAVASSPAAAQPSPAATVDSNGREACRVAWEAFNGDRLMTTDVLAAERPARDATDPAIRAAGAELLDAYREAVLSKSLADGDEVLTEARLLTASAKMNTACIEAGFSF